MSRVFVTQPNRVVDRRTGVPVEKLARLAQQVAPWGERTYIFEDAQRIHDANAAWSDVSRRLDALAYDAEKDYLVVTGDLTLGMLAFHEMMGRGGVRLLRWSDRKAAYDVLTFRTNGAAA